ncbi:unnamed protein product, partial [Polarella glacialis]
MGMEAVAASVPTQGRRRRCQRHTVDRGHRVVWALVLAAALPASAFVATLGAERRTSLAVGRDGGRGLHRRLPRVAPAPSRTRSSAAALAAYFAPAMLVTKHGAFSGIGEALTTILISEIGDKTFFLTMILAMRRGRILALSSALSALWVMTGLSASIGVMLRSLPSNLIREAWVRLAAGLLMIFFGIQSFRERESKLEVGPECKGAQDEAECEIESQLSRSKSQSFVIDWFRFSVLIFLAEWGDRSMFATVTLAATRSP